MSHNTHQSKASATDVLILTSAGATLGTGGPTTAGMDGLGVPVVVGDHP